MGTTVDPTRVEALFDRVRRDVDDGSLPSCQVALGFEGGIVASATFGDADDDTRFCVYSATKAFVVGVVWQLVDEGLIDPTALVVDYLPAFGTNGKDVITVEHVMLHTSGFPHAPMGPPHWDTLDSRLERYGQWRLNWDPGTACEYHPTSAHWVLADIAATVTGTDHRDLVAERITEPLGLPRVLGLQGDECDGIAELTTVGTPASAEELAAIGITELPQSEVTPDALLSANRPEYRAVGLPGGGAFMRASDLALYYQSLLHNPAALWSPGLLADVTGNVRNRLPDRLLGVPANRTLGLIVKGDDQFAGFRGFGHTASARAFGHNGAAGQIAFADPETGLSVGYCTNGVELNMIKEGRRTSGIASKAAACTTPP